MRGGATNQEAVRLEGVPVRTFLESQDHQHDLIRELQLIRIGERFDPATAEVSKRLAGLIADLLRRYDGVRHATRDQMLAALDRGEETAPLDVPVYPEMTEALQTWLELLEEADRLCQHGELLLLAASPDIRALRRWYATEVTARIAR